MQELSHSSVLFLHQLILTYPLVELHLTNVQLQDDQGWMLLLESVDLVLLKTLDLDDVCMN